MISWLKRIRSAGLTRKDLFILMVLPFIATATEIFGIGIFFPIFQFIRLEGNLNALVEDSSIWPYIIDGFHYFSIEPSLLILLFTSFTFFLVRQFFTYIRLIYNASVTQKLTQLQRNRVFNGYIEANTAYHDNTPVGSLVNVVTVEVGGLVTGVMAPIELMVYIIMLFGYLGVLFLLSWEMTLASGVVLLLATRIPNVWIKKSAQVGRKLVDINTLLTEFLVGRLRSPRLVKLSGTEVAEKNEFNKLTQEQRKYSVYGSVLLAKTDIAIEPFIVGLSLVFLYFSYTVLQLQVEAIGLYLVIILRLMPIIKSILSKWQSVQRSLGSIEAIEGRLKTMKASVEKDISDEPLICLKHSLFFNNVTYRYPQEKSDALKNITIEFEINKMTAIVGPSGSGKSTLIDFFPRLRSPRSGAILVDGERVEKYTLKSLRELIAYAPQAPQIFDGTVRNHILYGKNSATDEEIVQAARLAGADKFIKKLQQGYDTVLGEDAVRLSGGQRQRLDLARALVKKAPILILDEPTSNLDVESEEIFKNVLGRLKKETNTTIIIVTHRLTSIVDADQIVVLNQGTVEDIGEHAELLKKKGWYSKAWKMQNLSNHL